MIQDIVGQATGRFSERYFLTALIPTAVFAPAIVIVVLASGRTLDTMWLWFSSETTVVQIVTTFALVATIWFLATLLASQWSNVVRLYEGYPLQSLFQFIDRWAGRLGFDVSIGDPPGTAAHRRRLERLKDESDDPSTMRTNSEISAGRLHDNYPIEVHRVMPTSLGNIIRSAEDYGHHRYGFDSIYLWPRLASVLPSEFLVDIERSIIDYQTPLMVSFGSALLSTSSFFLIYAQVSTATFLGVFLGSALLSWISYRLSFSAARSYGDLLRTAVDLYRSDLLERWWPELLTIDNDRERLLLLRNFVVKGERPDPGPTRVKLRRGPAGPVSSPSRAANGTGALSGAPSRWGPRLSFVALVVVLLLGILGVRRLEEQEPILLLTSDVAAFSDLAGRTEVSSIRRGSIPDDAVASLDELGSSDAGFSVTALRNLDAGAVVRQSDVAPIAPSRSDSFVVVELVRNRTEIEGLGLRRGDSVLLQPGDPELMARCGGEGQRDIATEADVVSIAEPTPDGLVSVTLTVEAGDVARGCLGEEGSGVRMARALS